MYFNIDTVPKAYYLETHFNTTSHFIGYTCSTAYKCIYLISHNHMAATQCMWIATEHQNGEEG